MNKFKLTYVASQAQLYSKQNGWHTEKSANIETCNN